MVDVASLSLGAFGAATGVGALAFAIVHLRELRTTHDAVTDALSEVRNNLDATKEVRTEILSALSLHELLVKDALLGEVVNDIAVDYDRILRDDDPLFKDLMVRDLTRAQTAIRRDAGGQLSVSEDEIADAVTYAGILLNLAKSGDEFWASSLVDASFWRRATGYLEQNREQCNNGVHIKRVFVFDKEADFDAEARRQMALQVEAGVKVYYVINPQFEPRDLVLVRREIGDHEYEDHYAGECKLRADKSISSIDVWATRTYPQKVTDIRRMLTSMFNPGSSDPFVPDNVDEAVVALANMELDDAVDLAESPEDEDPAAKETRASGDSGASL